LPIYKHNPRKYYCMEAAFLPFLSFGFEIETTKWKHLDFNILLRKKNRISG